MIAERMAQVGRRLVRDYPPDGRAYWAERFWDRDAAERQAIIGDHFHAQKDVLSELISQYGADAGRILEFACGTGEFTGLAAERTTATQIVAMDISEQALDITRERVHHPGLRLVNGDFWADHDLGTADLVMCVDAIHHLGEVGQVLRRLRTFVRPGGVFIGNLWIADNFHEFQRERYGTIPHLARTAAFLGTAGLVWASNGRLRTGSYRTQLLQSAQIEPLLRTVFDEVMTVRPQRHFVAFACRRAD
jgi:SAM-dependent methyltransferase